MVSTRVNPLNSKDIEEIDHLFGKFFLVWELFQIEEFVALWWPALQRQSRAMQAIPTDLADRMTRMSPEGRGAFIAMASGSEAWRLHSEDAIKEATLLANFLTDGGLTLATPLPNPQDQLVAALDGGVVGLPGQVVVTCPRKPVQVLS